MKLSTQILLAFAIVLILSVLDTLSNYVLSLKVEKNTEFLNRSQEIIRSSGKLHKDIVDMQSSYRGYLLTQDTNFLDDYNAGIKNVPILIADEHQLVKDNPEQSAILDSIKILHQQWVEYANSLISARERISFSLPSEDPFNTLFKTKLAKQIGKKLNDAIDEKFGDFEKLEYRMRDIRSAALLSSIAGTHVFSLTFFALTIIIGILTTVYIISLISARIKTMTVFAEKISGGEFTTLRDNRNDELTRLSKSLNIMSVSLSKNISELRKRNEELDKFAYVVSHDLKAPLRGIHNVIKWIEEDLSNELSQQLRRYLDIILQRAKRMEDLINGLLDYARIRQKTQLEETDVHKMVQAIVEEIVPRDYSVEIKNLPVAVIERLKLEQVFTNLISNAVKYTTHEDALITISGKELDDHYEFSVKDNGIGIEPEYHEKIFEMFQTLREKDEKESTGIGLAIIKKILDEQHCTIHVHSELGKGAEFIFTWPRIKNV